MTPQHPVTRPSRPPRPILRPLIAWGLALPGLAIAVFLSYLSALFQWSGPKGFWTVAPVYLRLMAWLFGIRRKLEGWEQLPLEIREGHQAAIFVANHSSLFDPPLLVSTLPSHPVFVAKRELAFVPVLGWVIWLADFIFIDRGRRTKAVESLRRAATRIHEGQSVAAFPEGTRSRSGQVLPFKKGVFNLAWQAQVPVVPVGILGGWEILPADDWRTVPGDYIIRVGTPINPSACADVEALRKALEDAVRALVS